MHFSLSRPSHLQLLTLPPQYVPLPPSEAPPLFLHIYHQVLYLTSIPDSNSMHLVCVSGMQSTFHGEYYSCACVRACPLHNTYTITSTSTRTQPIGTLTLAFTP